MDKLIKLINEYEKINMCRKFDNFTMHTFENSSWVDSMLEDTVISRRYWFIEWLIKENKIDFELDKIIHKHKWIDYKTWKWIVVEKLCNKYESLLMLLSISDSPINDLISYLK